MKNPISPPYLAVGLLLIFSCQNNSSESPLEKELSDNATEVKCSDDPKFAIPRQQAQADISYYIKEMERYDSIVSASGSSLVLNFPLRFFTVRSIDLLEVLGLPLKDSAYVKYDYIRTYIGLNESSGFKLYLTPVDSADLNAKPPRAGKDHYLCGWLPDENTDILSQQQYLLDFAMPCPNTCQ